MEFSELQLHPDLQRGISDAGFTACMPVQEQVLSHAFGGQDLYVQSQTGTGKTAAYLVAIFQRLLTEPLLGGKKALIMVPTRELATQVEEEAKMLGKYLPFKVGSFYGGVGYAHQQKLLRENAQILVGTPGRVLDLNGSGQMSLMDLSFLILDEADRMFDMGFYPDLRKLIKVVPPADKRQTMLFSATLNAWVKNLAWEYTKEPLEIEIAPEKVTVEEIDQLLYHVPSEDKMKMLLGVFERDKPESAIIFCNTKRYTEIVAKRLRINGIECEFIIGDLPQVKRQQIIDDVKSGVNKYLVATDVAARGLDVEGLALVVNYDLPNEAENYVHRIGRTARAGKTGKAISLASEQDVYQLPAIEKYLGKKIPSEVVVESMYAEDKSEGLRIRTDVYGDDRDDRRGASRGRASGSGARDGRGGDRRPSGARPPRREGARVEEQRPAGQAPHFVDREKPFVEESAAPPRGAPRGDRPRSPGRGDARGRDGRSGERNRNADRPRGDRVTPAPRDNREAAKTDLSRVSLEERLAYYKRKYGDEFAPREPSGGEAKRGKNQGGKGRDPRPQGGRGQGGRAQGGAGRQTKGASPAKGSTSSKKGEAAKGGLLGRILGIFSKKGTK
jgi:ATP-dependent RNA helicase RhlB